MAHPVHVVTQLSKAWYVAKGAVWLLVASTCPGENQTHFYSIQV